MLSFQTVVSMNLYLTTVLFFSIFVNGQNAIPFSTKSEQEEIIQYTIKRIILKITSFDLKTIPAKKVVYVGKKADILL